MLASHWLLWCTDHWVPMAHHRCMVPIWQQYHLWVTQKQKCVHMTVWLIILADGAFLKGATLALVLPVAALMLLIDTTTYMATVVEIPDLADGPCHTTPYHNTTQHNITCYHTLQDHYTKVDSIRVITRGSICCFWEQGVSQGHDSK